MIRGAAGRCRGGRGVAIDGGADVRSDQSRAKCRRGRSHYAQCFLCRAIRGDELYTCVCARGPRRPVDVKKQNVTTTATAQREMMARRRVI